MDELIDTVKMAFEKDSTVQVSTFRSLLVVRATSRQHRQARRLLGVIGAALDVTPPKSIAERDRERPLPMGLAPPARRDDVAPARDPFDDGAGDPFSGGADPFDPFGE